ncbi:MAG: T9SS type A sorting domain-containing protein, partial [candidate division Zixibacteria bacterium]|nr:T9SS type A sorting domain-containing protein [candidate division Zixibacteria bacterium]
LTTGSYRTDIVIYDSVSFNENISVPVYLYISSDDTVLIAGTNTMPGQMAVIPLYLNLSDPSKAVYLPIGFDNNTAELDSIVPNTAELPSTVDFYSSFGGGEAEIGLRLNETVFDTELIMPGNYEIASLFFTAGNNDVFNKIDTLSSDSSGLYILSESLEKKVPYVIPGELIIGNPTDIEEDIPENIPNDLYLSQNYPNPFNSSTSIDLMLNSNSSVSMKIYNILGQTVFDYSSVKLVAGTHRFDWDGTMRNSSHKAPSGIYFYRLETEDYAIVKKMVLLK